ncbi:Calx-beta domain-containing protein, partial [Motiliproteus sp. MSK22-1]|uniref:Calx-beta domain-containing protein n=1 Tax=Motiliproteus sp. MSK22-1 TaxID=1897630 RepID=UPI0018E9A1DC
MSFPRSFTAVRRLRAAFVSRFSRKRNLVQIESSTENLSESLVTPQYRFLSLFSLFAAVAAVAALFAFAGTAQASFSYTASPSQSPANPVETGTKVIYTLQGVADGNGVTKVDIFINVDGSNQTASFASENPNCTFTSPFFTCQSLSPFSNEVYRFSWDAPVGTSNIEFEAFCEHTDESDCTGGTTSTSTQAVDPSPGVLALSSQSLTVNEGNGSFSVTVTRSGGDAGSASIDIATADGTAVDGSDYSATSTTLTWNDGESGSKSVQVNLIDDSISESDEGLEVNLSNAQGATLGSPAQAIITVEDNDAPPGEIRVENSQLTVNEDIGNATLTVSRVNGSAGTVSLTITAVSGGTATNSVDYLFSSGVLQWADGEEGSKSITIGIVDDNQVEADETIPLLFDVAEFQISDSNVTMTIVDNDSVPGTIQFVSSEASVNEAAGTVSIQVSRSDGSTGAATVNVSSVAGSATADVDYTSVSSLLSWADGESGEKTVEISVLDDLLIEGSETINLELSDVTGASLGTPTTATVTISDDDEVSTLQISSIPDNVAEGDGSFTVSVSREGGSEGAAQVSITTAGSAVAGSDYSTDTTLLSWADGESGVKNLVITLVDDSELEGDETLEIQLSNVQGADLGSPASGTISILDNEIDLGSVQFDAAAVSVNESDGTATLSVNRTGSSGAASVDVSVTGGSAAGGEDYDFSGTTLSWANGESGSKSFTVSLTNDDSAEENETLTLNLSNPSDGLSVGAISSSTLTIQDDDSGLNPIEEAMKGIANGDPQREAVAQSIATICPQGVAETQLQNDCNALVGSALSDDGNVNA